MIRLEGVTVVRSSRIVASELSLEIAPGEAVAVIGPSASGKTSLLETVAGLTAPAHGQIHRGLDGVDEPASKSPTLRHLPRVGYAPAEAAAWPVMRVDEFLEVAAVSAGLIGKPLRLAVQRGLVFASCERLPDHRLERLSDGQRKRLLLAATLVHDPDLLVLDDPMRSLDVDGRSEVERVITDLALAGGSIVAALNDAVIGPCWSRVLLLNDGTLLDSRDSHRHPTGSWPAWSVDALDAWRRSVASSEHG
ncbi:MAG: ABC transporter ATP-binding protein [Pirellulales bacterium]|nr:ABC transporter ATP-binding protein [Pirellulales bacterium]